MPRPEPQSDEVTLLWRLGAICGCCLLVLLALVMVNPWEVKRWDVGSGTNFAWNLCLDANEGYLWIQLFLFLSNLIGSEVCFLVGGSNVCYFESVQLDAEPNSLCLRWVETTKQVASVCKGGKRLVTDYGI